MTWDDVRSHGFHIKKYKMQSKVILAITGLLILFPAICFFLFEFRDMPLGERIWSSLFQAVTPRTAGFNTVDLASMNESGQMMTILLMLIGGAPGSTAGGMKVTTLAVLIACATAVFRKRDSAQLFGRRIAQNTIATAATLFLLYIGLSIGGAMVISIVEGLPLMTCLYEATSALATVGLTLGITPELSILSRYILIGLMFLGRVGGLTLIYAAQTKKQVQVGKLPQEIITVG